MGNRAGNEENNDGAVNRFLAPRIWSEVGRACAPEEECSAGAHMPPISFGSTKVTVPAFVLNLSTHRERVPDQKNLGYETIHVNSL